MGSRDFDSTCSHHPAKKTDKNHPKKDVEALMPTVIEQNLE